MYKIFRIKREEGICGMGELALEIRELRFARRLCKELAEVNTEYIYQIRTLRGRIIANY